MPILKKNNLKDEEKKDTIFVGVRLPKEDVSFLHLFCLLKQLTKTSIIQELLSSWIEKKQKEYSKESLIQLIGEKAFGIYKGLPRQKKNFPIFRSQLRMEFQHKGIDEASVDCIIKALNNEKDKEIRC
jgi:hypothetical protein